MKTGLPRTLAARLPSTSDCKRILLVNPAAGENEMNEPEVMLEMLGGREHAPRTLAVVGLSDDPGKASYRVSAYMQAQGYRILPVNPRVESVLGEQSYASLRDLPERPDVVNVFRLPKAIPAIVEEMLELGFKNLWVQLGIVNEEAARTAEAGGIHVVMDRCIMVEHGMLMRGQR
jgi:predicted CoA-binding protein